MNEISTQEERALKARRSLLLAVALPIIPAVALLALAALYFGHSAAHSAWLAAACYGALTLAALCAWALSALGQSARALNATRDEVKRILLELDASPASLARDAELVARIGEKLAANLSRLTHERDGLQAIIAAMSDGILVVDSSRCVLMSNPAARKILGIPETGLLARSLVQLTQQAELLANIEMSIVAMQACSFEFQLPGDTPGQKRHIQAHCAPYQNKAQQLSGAVAVLNDISDLKRLERVRTEFVSNVSHELRTPLTSLLGYLETLESGDFNDREQAKEFLGICRTQAENLNRIVEDLLRLSRLENPQSEISGAQISLTDVVHTAAEQCRSQAEKRGVALNCALPAHEVWTQGDRGLLIQALGNLIENAIVYNRENGSVTVRLEPVPKPRMNGSGRIDAAPEISEWQLAVADTGIGIPHDALQRVFERFYRVDKARSRSQGGTGLGLAIVKHIALAHGASVHVESEVGQGSTFIIRFKSESKAL